MYIAEVVGTMVSTRKSENLVGMKLLVVKRLDSKNQKNEKSKTFSDVAVDCVGAGVGDKVLIVTGTTARAVLDNENAPVDASIIGIIDSLEV
jgi:Carbon dioxide concentrating mechanism/carboxysome shell protein